MRGRRSGSTAGYCRSRTRALRAARRAAGPASGQCLSHERLEVSEQALALGQQTALVEQPGADAGLDRLDQRTVLEPDLVVKGQQLVDVGGRDVHGEEVVEEARRPLGPEWRHRPGREVGRPRQRVDLRRRPEPVELSLGTAAVAAGAELAGAERVRLEPVGVRRDVDDLAEAGMRHRAVVALEVVLDGDLPVARELELAPPAEAELFELDSARGEELRQRAERLGERRRL